MADPSVQEVMEKRIPDRLAQNPALAKDIGAVVRFEISGDGGGIWSLDCTGEGKVTEGAGGEPKMVLTAAAPDFIKVVTGQLNPNMAAMSGKLRFKPMDMGLALKLAKLLG